MVDLVQQYDTEAEASTFDQVPAGTYEAQIIETSRESISKTKDVGECLSLCWQVVNGEHEKRLFWQRLNLWWTGPEKKAGSVVQIANQQFAAVRQACGQKVINDSDELCFIPCSVTYGPQKNNPEYNEVKAVKAAGGAPAKQMSAPGRQAAPPANSQQRAPWPRNAT